MSIDINCDVSKCPNKVYGLNAEYQVGKEWNRVQVQNTLCRTTRHFYICPECSTKLGIDTLKDAKDPGQLLLDALYDVVQEIVEDTERQ